MRTKLKILLVAAIIASVADIAWLLYGVFGGVFTQITQFTGEYIVYVFVVYALNFGAFRWILREMKKERRKQIFEDFMTKLITVLIFMFMAYILAPLILFIGTFVRLTQARRTWDSLKNSYPAEREERIPAAGYRASREEQPRAHVTPAPSAKPPFPITTISEEAAQLLLDNSRAASFTVTVENGQRVKFKKVVALKEIGARGNTIQFVYGWADGEVRGFFPRAFLLLGRFLRAVTPTEQEIACNLYLHWQYGDSPSLLELSEDQDEKFLGDGENTLDAVAELDDLHVRLSDGRMHLCRRVCYFSRETGYGTLWGFWGAVCEPGGEYNPYDAVFLLIYATSESAFVVQSVPGDPLYEECCAATQKVVQAQIDEAVMGMYEGKKISNILVGFDRRKAYVGPLLAMLPDEERSGCGYIAVAIEAEEGSLACFVHCVDDTHRVVSDEAEHTMLFERLKKYMQEEGE